MEDSLRLPVADRLTGQSNYRAWKSYVQPMLDAKDLWQYADPDDLASREPVATEEGPGSDKLKKEWSKGNKIARAWLISTLAPNIALMVSNYSTARQVWTFLDNQYEPEGMAQEYSAWQKFRDVHYEGKELPKFLEDYRLAVNDLEMSHVQLEERIKVYNLIACVAPYFESFAANKREQFRQMRRKDKAKLPTCTTELPRLSNDSRDAKLLRAIDPQMYVFLATGCPWTSLIQVERREPFRANLEPFCTRSLSTASKPGLMSYEDTRSLCEKYSLEHPKSALEAFVARESKAPPDEFYTPASPEDEELSGSDTEIVPCEDDPVDPLQFRRTRPRARGQGRENAKRPSDFHGVPHEVTTEATSH